MSGLASLYTQNAGPRLSKKAFRSVPQAPERILDAPDLLDDYYLNLLDWGSNNMVRAALTAYLHAEAHATSPTSAELPPFAPGA